MQHHNHHPPRYRRHEQKPEVTSRHNQNITTQPQHDAQHERCIFLFFYFFIFLFFFYFLFFCMQLGGLIQQADACEDKPNLLRSSHATSKSQSSAPSPT
jgi:quinol-cytochrome oxidoreductase complex cytochrome b subunit